MSELAVPQYLTLEEQLGQRIQSARNTFKISQRELAERAGLTQAVVSKIEAGTANPTLSTVQKIADALYMHPSITLRIKHQ